MRTFALSSLVTRENLLFVLTHVERNFTWLLPIPWKHSLYSYPWCDIASVRVLFGFFFLNSTSVLPCPCRESLLRILRTDFNFNKFLHCKMTIVFTYLFIYIYIYIFNQFRVLNKLCTLMWVFLGLSWKKMQFGNNFFHIWKL